MIDIASTTYDEILYTGHAYPQTHPDRLAISATLFDMKTAPVQHCRVLELACGDGGNIVPMAFALPESEFVGIDLAARPIIKGQEMVEALGLKNVTLRRLDLMALPPELGQFDYIIAHGLYSWVPPAVQDKFLAVCKSHLAPQGVAYISYNTFPGAHLRKMVSEMMLFHIRNFSEPQQRIKQAVALVKFLAESQTATDTYSAFLQAEFEQVLKYEEGHLFHDDLAEINSPAYFTQFMGHAAQHGLQFLGEADFYEMQYHIYPQQTAELLQQMATENIILKEQYLDFLKCRRFRQTLLCHEHVSLNRTLNPELIRELYLASPAQPASSEPDVSSQAVEEFHGKRGAKVATDFPPAKAALWHLGQIYPQSIRFDELLAKSQSLLKTENFKSAAESEEVEVGATLAQILFQVYTTDLIELAPRPSDFVLEVSERPLASPLARWQIQQDTIVTNLRHTSVLVEGALSKQLLLSLDGTKDRTALLETLIPLVQSGEADLLEEGAPVRDPQRIRELLPDELEKNLKKLARLALLIA
jgi:methyltransferase-like protein/2-polyprenyl-3-methyl-5-hydroxy-6-metoxy-1,4-benzoquinol methylase